jgi:hypothetical protein
LCSGVIENLSDFLRKRHDLGGDIEMRIEIRRRFDDSYCDIYGSCSEIMMHVSKRNTMGSRTRPGFLEADSHFGCIFGKDERKGVCDDQRIVIFERKSVKNKSRGRCQVRGSESGVVV